MRIVLFIFTCYFSLAAFCQQPPTYTKKNFVTEKDTSEFKVPRPVDNGVLKTYIQTIVPYYDIDDKNSTHIRTTQMALLYIESDMKNGKRHGTARQYLIDAGDHSKRYLIAEQSYANDQVLSERDGLRTYYYPGGKPWIEQIYKEGKPWTIVANYDSKGNKRNGGTLKE